MHLQALRLTDFRNHAAFALELDARPVCLIGPNGVGKTNILEALTMLAPGRGLRSASLGEIARGGEAGAEGRGGRPWSVYAEAVEGGAVRRLGVGAEITPEGALRRVARLDGRPASGAEMASALRMAWITPALDRLFAGPPGDRRRFLDRLTLARAAEHGAAAAGYERAMRERQRLLSDDVRDPAWLSALEREMAAHGAAVAAARVETVARLKAAIAARAESPFPMALVALEGELEAAFAAGEPSAVVEDRFAESLRQSRGRDAAAGRALAGPHRSDLLVRHAEKDMPAALSSTGEQKALLLGIVIAHVRALAQDLGAGPALLLVDEAGAHLDPARRAALAEELLALPGQAWLTGVEASLFEGFGERARRVTLTAESARPA